MASLSSAKSVCQAADDDACRALLLQALSYGTDYDVSKKKDKLTERSQETAIMLVQVMQQQASTHALLVDSLWLVASLVQEGDESSRALIHIIRSLASHASQEFLSNLQATLDPSLLEAANLGGKDALLKKIRKLNTETHYRQHKFNLLQEESEGYAKLLTLLLGASFSSQNLRDLIGTFELDPNRVLDLLLDVLESHLRKSTDKPTKNDQLEQLVVVIKDFSVEKIPHLMGFKITSASPKIPHGLYATVAFLALEGLLDLGALLPHLSSIAEIDNAYDLYAQVEQEAIQASTRVRLASSSDKKDAAASEQAAKLKQARDSLQGNALIGLAQVLVKWNEWDLAKTLLQKSAWPKVCTLLPHSIGQALCQYVSDAIQDVYHATVPNPLQEQDAMVVDSSLEAVLSRVLEPLNGILRSQCIQSHPILYCQLCRLLRAFLQQQESTEKLSTNTHALLQLLVPAMSLFPSNPAIASDLWSLLSMLPYPTRYALYRHWKSTENKPLVQSKCETLALKEARYILKRLSKDNIRDMGRQISKVTHSNPLIVFFTILNQVEAYDNLIEMMVEAVRFVTPLGLDVLGYCILSRLDGSSGSGNRSRMKDDGVNVSQWLSSLESFTGAFYRKCPQVELRGILWYVISRLKEGHLHELGILRALLKNAGGYGFADYSPVASLDANQLSGRAGSQMLKRETFAFGVVEQINRRASRKVRAVLQDDDIGIMLLTLLAQIKTKIIFDTSGKKKQHVKLIGNVHDSCQVLMSILVDFLTDTTDEALESGQVNGLSTAMKLYAESLPSLGELHGKYGLDAETAWMMCRPISRSATVVEDDNGSTEAVQSFLATGDSMSQIYRGMLPEKAWDDITPDLFELFYSHSLYDISCPESSYEAQITRLKKEAERLTQKQKGNVGPMMLGAPFGRADELELERVKRVSDILAADMSLQKKRNESKLESLKERKGDCFPTDKVSPKTIKTFLMYCIYPRSMATPDDAMFCARFVSLLHKNETPGFSMLHYVDELVNVVAGALFCVTEGEAATMAILLLETWSLVSKWRYDEDAYAKEVAGKPGSYFLLNGEIVSISYKQYESLYNKWHARLGAAFMGCLGSSEYMYTRACLLVLTRIVDVFPTRPGLGQRLIEALEPLQDESYPLPDIKTAAQAYGMRLIKARADGVWKEEDAAVAEARVRQEKEALAERQKEADKRFEAMKLENQKITAELREDEIRGRDDRSRRRPPLPRSDVRSPLRPGAPSFEPARGVVDRAAPSRGATENGTAGHHRRGEDARGRDRDRSDSRDRDRRSIRDRDSRRGRDDNERGRAPPPRPDRDRHGGGDGRRGDVSRADAGRDSSRRSGIRDTKPSGLDGRWERGVDVASSRATGAGKRSRSPVEEDNTRKRGKSDRDGDDDESRRDDRGRMSPNRRGTQRESSRGTTRRSDKRGPPRR